LRLIKQIKIRTQCVLLQEDKTYTVLYFEISK